MESTLLDKTSQQIKSVLCHHIAELTPYFDFPEVLEVHVPGAILTALDRLSTLCEYPHEAATVAHYREAQQHLCTVNYFLEVMNQQQDAAFRKTALGEILERARMWTQAFYAHKWEPTISQVWDLIDPVKPDTLTQLGTGVYEACWWKPVPIMDIEILYRTDGITIQGAAFEPEDMSGGIAVRFSLM